MKQCYHSEQAALDGQEAAARAADARGDVAERQRLVDDLQRLHLQIQRTLSPDACGGNLSLLRKKLRLEALPSGPHLGDYPWIAPHA